MLTALALLAFAANSVLCRMALQDGAIDPASFTTIRMVSGALTLALIVVVRGTPRQLATQGSWASAAALVVYALAFSFAYVSLEAGVGALILFAAVQITMIAWALVRGERPGLLEWIGLAAAFSGLIYLLIPGASAPPLMASLLMVLAGIAWGAYSLRGRAATNALADTASNFVRGLPVVLLASLIYMAHANATLRGILLAVTSGAIASGLGYVVWYSALRHLSAMRAAIVQLAVPVIAALGGVALLGEKLSWHLAVSSMMILGGIVLAIRGAAKSC